VTDTLCQVVITACSVATIWLQGYTSFRRKRIGFAISLCAQPFWFWTAWTHGQWGIMFLAGWFTFCNVRGIWKHR
jgi:hypothetical protein